MNLRYFSSFTYSEWLILNAYSYSALFLFCIQMTYICAYLTSPKQKKYLVSFVLKFLSASPKSKWSSDFFSRYCYRQNSPTWLTQSHWGKKSIEILIFSLKCINLDYFQLDHTHQILQKDNSIQKFYMGVGMYSHVWHHPKWEPQSTSFLACICVCKKNEKYPSFSSGGYCKSKYLAVWLTERISGQNLSYET